MSTNDPLDPVLGNAPAAPDTAPTGVPDGVPDGEVAGAVHRRLSRALADLGIAPQPIGPRVQNWTTLVDGVVTFGALSITTAARLANVLEDIAATRVNVPTANRDDSGDDAGQTSPDFAPTFEPVASPYEPGASPSRFHPRVAN